MSLFFKQPAKTQRTQKAGRTLSTISASKVKKLLPKHLYNRVAPIILPSSSSDYLDGSERSIYEKDEQRFRQTSFTSGSNTLLKQNITKKSTCSDNDESEFSMQEFNHTVASDLHMHPPSIKTKSVTANASTSRTPQFRFMQYAEHEAAWWRVDTKECDISLLPLEQRAKIITSRIIADFLQWQKNFLASEIPILAANVLAELFDVEFDKPIAHALCNNLREIPYVTPMVAKENAMPEREYSAGLHSQILKDVKQEKLQPHTIAFGTTLPSKPRLRVQPPKNHVQEQWLDASEVTKRLLSMEAVFKDITSLRSTTKFCQWLQNHPQTPPATYLTKCGMVKPTVPVKTTECLGTTNSTIRKMETHGSIEKANDVMNSSELLLARSLMEYSPNKIFT